MASKTIEPVLATDNVVILEVDNLLSGWPTYIVDFTPKKTGPVDSVPYQPDREDLDSDEEENGNKVTNNKRALPPPGASLMATIEPCTVEYITLSVIPLQANVTAVVLHGVFKDGSQAIRKRKAKEAFKFPNEIPWPPYWSRAFRSVPVNSPTTALEMVRTFAAPIQPSTSPVSTQAANCATVDEDPVVSAKEGQAIPGAQLIVQATDEDEDDEFEDKEDSECEDEEDGECEDEEDE